MTMTFTVPAGYRLTVEHQSDGTVVVTIEPIEPIRSGHGSGRLIPIAPLRLQCNSCRYQAVKARKVAI
jgi:hypothetical protein